MISFKVVEVQVLDSRPDKEDPSAYTLRCSQLHDRGKEGHSKERLSLKKTKILNICMITTAFANLS